MFSFLMSLLSHAFHFILGIATPQGFPPPLSQEEEREAFIRAAEGDENARQKLILHNLRLVSHIVRKYYSASPNQEDLVSIGTVGLVKAVDSFRMSNGTRFATYAAKCIQNEILMHFRSRKKLSGEVSINETIDVDRDGNPLTYMDIISVEDNVGDEIDRKDMIKRAMQYINTSLTERERQIIIMRYGLCGLSRSYAQREIAQKLNISRSYVSRIEKSAIEKLNQKFRS